MNSKPVCCLVLSLCIGLLMERAGSAEPPITSVVFSPDGKSAIACSQVGVQVYSWPELKRYRTIKVRAANLHDVAFSPAGNRLAVGGGTPTEEGSVEIFSWPMGKSLAVLDGPGNSVMGLAWLSESSLAAASLDHSVMLWNTRIGPPGRRLEGHSRGVTSLCFLKKEKILVSSGIDRSLRVWRPGSGELIRSLGIHTRRVHNLALRPGDGGLPMVASVSGDRTLRLWQPTIGRMVRFVRLRTRPLDVAWRPDGSRLVVACADGHVREVDPVTVKVTRDLPAVDGWAYSLAVHPTDQSVVVGGSGGQLRRIMPNAEK
ncbi:MAG: WD40 repeat domain-containing protein [Planctomycetaceae bacterium]